MIHKNHTGPYYRVQASFMYGVSSLHTSSLTRSLGCLTFPLALVGVGGYANQDCQGRICIRQREFRIHCDAGESFDGRVSGQVRGGDDRGARTRVCVRGFRHRQQSTLSLTDTRSHSHSLTRAHPVWVLTARTFGAVLSQEADQDWLRQSLPVGIASGERGMSLLVSNIRTALTQLRSHMRELAPKCDRGTNGCPGAVDTLLGNTPMLTGLIKCVPTTSFRFLVCSGSTRMQHM